jgi:hypothetical protein
MRLRDPERMIGEFSVAGNEEWMSEEGKEESRGVR